MKKTVDCFIVWDNKKKSQGVIWYKGQRIGVLQGVFNTPKTGEFFVWNAYCSYHAIEGQESSIIETSYRTGADEGAMSVVGFHVLSQVLLVTQVIDGSFDHKKFVKYYLSKFAPTIEQTDDNQNPETNTK